MDPFDDYDPQAYDYDESDQDDDIVYLEAPVAQGEDPFLPYLAKDLNLSQSQLSQSSQYQQPQPQQHVEAPSLLPRRERQRRRTEQAAAQMMEESSSDSELSNNPADNEEQDAFASLQSLLDRQSKQEKEKDDEQNEDSGMMEASFDAQAAETNPAVDTGPAEQPAPMQGVNNNLLAMSQSQQFPLADDDWDPSQAAHVTQTRNVPLVSNSFADYTMSIGGPSSISSDLTKELQRHWKPQSSQQPLALTDPPSAVDSTLLSELEKNRKRAQRKITSRPKKRSDNTRSQRTQFNRKHAKVTSSKSIVGTRPQHWGAARSSSVPSKQSRKRTGSSSKSPHLAVSSDKARRSSFHNKAKSGRPLNEFPNRISFAPQFFHSKRSNQQQQQQDGDAIESTQQSDRPLPYQTPRILQRFNQNASAAYSAGSGSGGSDSGKRKRKQGKKLKAGPLMKRLRALRSAVDGDAIRFQSGMYPFAQSATRRFDLSDPRNRATSFMDVSIVCEPVPWDEHQRITVLGFIHRFEKVGGKQRANDIENVAVESGRFAWISFTYDTAREQNVRKGSTLRIYNTISVPCSTLTQIEGYGADSVVENRCCDQTVLCTQLCEQYPDSLPKLPDVVQVKSN